ncbi:MAG: 2-dehydropantoate 2-reductase [Chloroflexota bacterium]
MTTYTIIGAGAIGGTVGAYMARGGLDVRFVDADADHVAAMNRDGLTIRGYDETFTVPAQAVTPAELPDSLGAVLIAVKAPATQTVLEQITPRLADDGFIVSAQNGLNELVIGDAVGRERTVGCFINFSADYLEPGIIHFGGPGAFWLGELDGAVTPRLDQLQTDLNHWGGGDVRMTDNIWGFLWGKMTYGAILFATALTNETMADAISDYRLLMVGIAREVLAVAAREQVAPMGFDGFEPEILGSAEGAELDASIERMVAIRRRDQKTHTGVWRDLAIRKRKTEVDAMYGPILDLAGKYGVETPLLTRMVAMIHEIEDGARPLQRESLDELQSVKVS